MPYFPPSGLDFPRLSRRWYVYTDCESGDLNTTGVGDWVKNASGTGATVAGAVTWAANMVGAMQIQLGTVNTNHVSIRVGNTTLRLAGGLARYYAVLRYEQLSNVTDTYSSRVGFISASNSESTNGVFFRYAYTVNAGKFEAVTRAASVETATDTGITVAINTPYRMMIVVNDIGTSVGFYINGALVATNTANIPTADIGCGITVIRTVGTAICNPLSVDLIEAEIIFTTPR
ncbi:MAG: hypothetical protein H0U63_01145 [Burkholderiales bacterium]|nr:hypothetical protein [Burkholderiales bacterium]